MITSPPQSPRSPAAVTGWRSLDLAGWATVQVPRRWTVTPFEGVPATVYLPLDFVSSAPLPSPCNSGAESATCVGPRWFAPTWRTPERGLLVLWAHAQYPVGSEWGSLPGRRAVIDDLAAKRYSGPATAACPDGTAREVDAFVSASSNPAKSGERFDMRACLGPRVSSTDQHYVDIMVTSLRVERR